nr:retrovirus-related Pol polyprotein from transposon TNT 1-94 [Tanacetum cinerariifolium]
MSLHHPSEVLLLSTSFNHPKLSTFTLKYSLAHFTLMTLASQRICHWWNIQWEEVSSFVDWFTWFGFIRLSSKLKAVLEGVFYSAWWHVWSFRNRTDHGREFDNEVQFGEFCNANGIRHNFSAPNTPQSNGVVERKNKTLQEMSRTMLNEQSFSQKFWCNTVDTSTYILNRIPIRSILEKTPYELLRGRKPTLDYFKVFGSKCFILNTKDYLTKFYPKLYEGVFLVNPQNSKAYIILNKHTMKIEESLNVTFDEAPPPSKTSPFVDDDFDEEEAIKVTEKKNLENNIKDETLKFDEIVNIKESNDHPLGNVIGDFIRRNRKLYPFSSSRLIASFDLIFHIPPRWDTTQQRRSQFLAPLPGRLRFDYQIEAVCVLKTLPYYCCSDRSLGDKIICDLDKTPDLSQQPPQNYPKCGHPVDGQYCQCSALLRKKFKEGLFTYCNKNGILQDPSEPSNDNTNVANALQEPFVVNQDPDKNSSQSPPQINHHCCYGCGDPLEDIFCHQCTCELCGNGAHYRYNCPSKVPIEEEKQIEEEQAAKTRYWKILACYDDDDDDYTIAITHKEPDNSLTHDRSPSLSRLLIELNLSPQFALSFVVANGISMDCQGVFVVGEGIIGQEGLFGSAGVG